MLSVHCIQTFNNPICKRRNSLLNGDQEFLFSHAFSCSHLNNTNLTTTIYCFTTFQSGTSLQVGQSHNWIQFSAEAQIFHIITLKEATTAQSV